MIYIPSTEGSLVGRIPSLRTRADAEQVIDQLLGGAMTQPNGHDKLPRHLHDVTAQIPVIRTDPRHAHRTGEQRAVQPWETAEPTSYQPRIDQHRAVNYPPPLEQEPFVIDTHEEWIRRPSRWARIKSWFTGH